VWRFFDFPKNCQFWVFQTIRVNGSAGSRYFKPSKNRRFSRRNQQRFFPSFFFQVLRLLNFFFPGQFQGQLVQRMGTTSQTVVYTYITGLITGKEPTVFRRRRRSSPTLVITKFDYVLQHVQPFLLTYLMKKKRLVGRKTKKKVQRKGGGGGG